MSSRSKESLQLAMTLNLMNAPPLYILIIVHMITVNDFQNKSFVKKFLLQEAEKMKASCISGMKDGIYHRTWGYTPDTQSNLAWYNNGGTSQDGAYVEIALQSDIREK
nr:MAG TPA: hypothetical protein [Caudoviricetes sp.]